MNSLLAMFGGGGGGVRRRSFANLKKTVVEEGNVAPGQAFKKSMKPGHDESNSN